MQFLILFLTICKISGFCIRLSPTMSDNGHIEQKNIIQDNNTQKPVKWITQILPTKTAIRSDCCEGEDQRIPHWDLFDEEASNAEKLNQIHKNYIQYKQLQELHDARISIVEKEKIAKEVLDMDNTPKVIHLYAGGLMDDFLFIIE